MREDLLELCHCYHELKKLFEKRGDAGSSANWNGKMMFSNKNLFSWRDLSKSYVYRDDHNV